MFSWFYFILFGMLIPVVLGFPLVLYAWKSMTKEEHEYFTQGGTYFPWVGVIAASCIVRFCIEVLMIIAAMLIVTIVRLF